jgi:hypothetical protein
MTAASRESEDGFWQKLIFLEEDRRSLFPGIASIVSARRWSRSPNMVDPLRCRRRCPFDNSEEQQA